MPQTDQVHPDQAFFLPQAVLIAAQVARRQARRAVPGKAHRIEKGAGQRDCQGGGSKILDPVMQNDAGQPRIIGIEGNQGRVSHERRADGHFPIPEFHADQWVFPSHLGPREMGETGEAGRIEAVRPGVGRQGAGRQDPGRGLTAIRAAPQGEKCVSQDVALARAVPDLPIPEFAPSAQGDVARADAPQGESGLGGLPREPPTDAAEFQHRSHHGLLSDASGSAGNGACGSVWYQ